MDAMGDILTFRKDGTIERTWVPKAEEDWWIRFWGRGGIPAARLRDYQRWGGFFPRLTDSSDRIRLHTAEPRERRKRTNYAHWSPPE